VQVIQNIKQRIFSSNLWCRPWFPPPSQGATAPSGTRPPHHQGFTITLRHTTLVKTPLDEWSARRRDLYIHNSQNSQERETSKLPAGFEPAFPASDGPETHAFHGAATGISSVIVENAENHEGIRSGRRFVVRSSKQALPCYEPASLQLEAKSAVLQEQNFTLPASHRPGQRIARTL